MRKYIFERITNFTTKATPEIQTPTQARINTLKKETEELPKIITLLNKNKNLYKNSDDFNKLLNVVTAQNKNNKAEIAYLNAKLSNINAINDIKKQYVKEKREQRIT